MTKKITKDGGLVLKQSLILETLFVLSKYALYLKTILIIPIKHRFTNNRFRVTIIGSAKCYQKLL